MVRPELAIPVSALLLAVVLEVPQFAQNQPRQKQSSQSSTSQDQTSQNPALQNPASQNPASQNQASKNQPSAPTFYRDVLPILQDHCQSCHRAGEIGPMPLVTYEQTKWNARAIAKQVQSKRMPPWFADPCCGHFSDDPTLTQKQIATLAAWASQNTPAGDPQDAPHKPSFAEGWNIAPPDVVLEMPKPVSIPS